MQKKLLIVILLLFFQACTHAGDTDLQVRTCDFHKERAENNEIISSYLLGMCYRFGQGRKQDIQQAVYWFNKASEQDYLPATESLNTIYLLEPEYKDRASNAVDALQELLEKDYGRAGVVLARAYHEGKGVIKNDAEAIIFLEKAARLNVPQAIAGMYYVHHLGLLGESADKKKADLWLSLLDRYGKKYSILKETGNEYLLRFKESHFREMMGMK